MKKYVLIAGSTKCGTTSLFHFLTDHPSVGASFTKETRYFLDERYPLPRRNEVLDSSDYSMLFPEQAEVCCESTPDYLYSENAPVDVSRELGGSAIVVLVVREPVDRFISWFNYSKQIGEIRSECSLDEYLSLQYDGHYSNCETQVALALQQGLYYPYVQRWIEALGKDNVMVFDFETLKHNPSLIVKAICEKTNLSQEFYQGYEFAQKNKTKDPRSQIASKIYYKAARFFTAKVTKNKLVRIPFKAVKKILEAMIFQNGNKSKTPHSENAVNFIVNYYSDSFSKLRDILVKLDR